MFIHTAHGVGRVVEESDEGRGRRRYRVAGEGWSVWVDAGSARLAQGFGGPADMSMTGTDPGSFGAPSDPAMSGGAMPQQMGVPGVGGDAQNSFAQQADPGAASTYQVDRSAGRRAGGSYEDYRDAADWDRRGREYVYPKPEYLEHPEAEEEPELLNPLNNWGKGWPEGHPGADRYPEVETEQYVLPYPDLGEIYQRHHAAREGAISPELWEALQEMRGEIHKVRPLLDDPEGTVGGGFDRGVEEWRREAAGGEGNSTVLPWNPEPQYPSAVMPDEQTLAPGDRAIDPDERLSPADSVSFDEAEDPQPWPGPDPHLFARRRVARGDGGGAWVHPGHVRAGDLISWPGSRDPRADRGMAPNRGRVKKVERGNIYLSGGGSLSRMHKVYIHGFDDKDREACRCGECSGGREGRLAVNTDGMDPDSHAYHVELPQGRGGEVTWVDDAETYGRNPRRRWDPDFGWEQTDEDERRAEGVAEDDESGYNWGPEPSPDREARRVARMYAGIGRVAADDKKVWPGWEPGEDDRPISPEDWDEIEQWAGREKGERREAALPSGEAWGKGEFREHATGEEARQAVDLIKRLLEEGRDLEAQLWASKLGLGDEFKKESARRRAAGDDEPVGKCQNCGVAIFDRDSGDPHQDAMSHLCWKCVKPHGVPMRGRQAGRWSDEMDLINPLRAYGREQARTGTCPQCGPGQSVSEPFAFRGADKSRATLGCGHVVDRGEAGLGKEAGVDPYAGLSDKYVRPVTAADHFGDPVQRFRDDPVGEIERVGNAHLAEVDEDPRMREYVALVEHDERLRTAAWADVREKALRLRREGKVTVNDIGEGRIYATVEGDHGTYDTMIVKGGNLGVGAQSISNWHCACPWGYWAFKRRFSYVGRLCSHGYAAYLEMQSRHHKENPIRRRYNPGGPSRAWDRADSRIVGAGRHDVDPVAPWKNTIHEDKYWDLMDTPDFADLYTEDGEPVGKHRAEARWVTAGLIADFHDFVNKNFGGRVSDYAWSQFAKQSGADPQQWGEVSGWFDKHPPKARQGARLAWSGDDYVSEDDAQWWDCPRCEQGNDLDDDECQDCGFNRWDHEDPDELLRRHELDMEDEMEVLEDRAEREARKLTYDPDHLAPEFREVPGPGGGRTVDVEEDERESTGPDDVAGPTRNWFTDPPQWKKGRRVWAGEHSLPEDWDDREAHPDSIYNDRLWGMLEGAGIEPDGAAYRKHVDRHSIYDDEYPEPLDRLGRRAAYDPDEDYSEEFQRRDESPWVEVEPGWWQDMSSPAEVYHHRGSGGYAAPLVNRDGWKAQRSNDPDDYALVPTREEAMNIVGQGRHAGRTAAGYVRPAAPAWSGHDWSDLSSESMQRFVDNINSGLEQGGNPGQIMLDKAMAFKEELRRRQRQAAGKGVCKECGDPIENIKGLRPGLCSMCNDIAMEWEMDDELGDWHEGSRRRADSYTNTSNGNAGPGSGSNPGLGAPLVTAPSPNGAAKNSWGDSVQNVISGGGSGEGGGHGSGGEQQGGTLALGLPDVAFNAFEHGFSEHGMASTSADDTTPWNAGPMGPGAKQSAADRAYWSRMASALEELRALGDEGIEDSLGDLPARNDRVRDAVDEARDEGYDASQFVASQIRRYWAGLFGPDGGNGAGVNGQAGQMGILGDPAAGMADFGGFDGPSAGSAPAAPAPQQSYSSGGGTQSFQDATGSGGSKSFAQAGRYHAGDLANDLVQAQGEEVEGIGQYQQFLDDARAAGDEGAASMIEEILGDEHDHARELADAVGRQAARDDDMLSYEREGVGTYGPYDVPAAVELPDASDEDLAMELLRNRAPHGQVGDGDRDWDDEVMGEFSRRGGGEQPNDYLFDELGRYRPERFEGKEGSAWFGQLAAAPEPAEAQAGDHLPFNGSGHADSLEFDSTDEDGSAGAHLVDVTDLGEGGLPKAAGVIVDVTDGDGVIKYGDDDKPVIERFAENLPAGWGSNPDNPSKDEDLPLPPGVGPVVDGVKQVLPQLPGMLGDAGLGKAGARSVRRIGGGLRAGQAAQSFSDGDIAGAAKAFLRTAGRVYSPGEQKRLEEEFHPEGARNLGDLELGGTHYEGA